MIGSVTQVRISIASEWLFPDFPTLSFFGKIDISTSIPDSENMKNILFYTARSQSASSVQEKSQKHGVLDNFCLEKEHNK